MLPTIILGVVLIVLLAVYIAILHTFFILGVKSQDARKYWKAIFEAEQNEMEYEISRN